MATRLGSVLLFHQPRNSEFKLIGQASLSAQFQVKLKVSTSFSICLGPVCGGVQANGFWDMAVGVDIALTTTTGGANDLDADKNGCREWTFESKLTNYAEYPQSDCVSRVIMEREVPSWAALAPPCRTGMPQM